MSLKCMRLFRTAALSSPSILQSEMPLKCLQCIRQAHAFSRLKHLPFRRFLFQRILLLAPLLAARTGFGLLNLPWWPLRIKKQ